MKYEPSGVVITILYKPDDTELPVADVRFHCTCCVVGCSVVTILPCASTIITVVAVLPVLMVTVPVAGFGYALMPAEYASVTDAAISQVPLAATALFPPSADVMSRLAV